MSTSTLGMHGCGRVSVVLINDDLSSNSHGAEIVKSSNPESVVLSDFATIKWITIENGIVFWYSDELCEVPDGFGILFDKMIHMEDNKFHTGERVIKTRIITSIGIADISLSIATEESKFWFEFIHYHINDIKLMLSYDKIADLLNRNTYDNVMTGYKPPKASLQIQLNGQQHVIDVGHNDEISQILNDFIENNSINRNISDKIYMELLKTQVDACLLNQSHLSKKISFYRRKLTNGMILEMKKDISESHSQRLYEKLMSIDAYSTELIQKLECKSKRIEELEAVVNSKANNNDDLSTQVQQCELKYQKKIQACKEQIADLTKVVSQDKSSNVSELRFDRVKLMKQVKELQEENRRLKVDLQTEYKKLYTLNHLGVDISEFDDGASVLSSSSSRVRGQSNADTQISNNLVDNDSYSQKSRVYGEGNDSKQKHLGVKLLDQLRKALQENRTLQASNKKCLEKCEKLEKTSLEQDANVTTYLQENIRLQNEVKLLKQTNLNLTSSVDKMKGVERELNQLKVESNSLNGVIIQNKLDMVELKKSLLRAVNILQQNPNINEKLSNIISVWFEKYDLAAVDESEYTAAQENDEDDEGLFQISSNFTVQELSTPIAAPIASRLTDTVTQSVSNSNQLAWIFNLVSPVVEDRLLSLIFLKYVHSTNVVSLRMLDNINTQLMNLTKFIRFAREFEVLTPSGSFTSSSGLMSPRKKLTNMKKILISGEIDIIFLNSSKSVMNKKQTFFIRSTKKSYLNESQQGDTSPSKLGASNSCNVLTIRQFSIAMEQLALKLYSKDVEKKIGITFDCIPVHKRNDANRLALEFLLQEKLIPIAKYFDMIPWALIYFDQVIVSIMSKSENYHLLETHCEDMYNWHHFYSANYFELNTVHDNSTASRASIAYDIINFQILSKFASDFGIVTDLMKESSLFSIYEEIIHWSQVEATDHIIYSLPSIITTLNTQIAENMGLDDVYSSRLVMKRKSSNPEQKDIVLGLNFQGFVLALATVAAQAYPDDHIEDRFESFMNWISSSTGFISIAHAVNQRQFSR